MKRDIIIQKYGEKFYNEVYNASFSQVCQRQVKEKFGVIKPLEYFEKFNSTAEALKAIKKEIKSEKD